MKKDDDELEGMEPQEPAEDNSTDNGNASGTPAPEGGDGNDGDGDEPQAHSTYQVPKDKKLQLSGMYENWFLDYASYVILERAVPHKSTVRLSNWVKKSCLSTPRVTGVTSSPATVRLPDVTSRHA